MCQPVPEVPFIKAWLCAEPGDASTEAILSVRKHFHADSSPDSENNVTRLTGLSRSSCVLLWCRMYFAEVSRTSDECHPGSIDVVGFAWWRLAHRDFRDGIEALNFFSPKHPF